FLSLAIVAMFSSQGKSLFENIHVVLLLLFPVLLFFAINFILGRIVSRFLKIPYEDSVSLNLTALARNSPISLAIAVTAFPYQSLMSLTLVIAPLIVFPILAIVSPLLLRIRRIKSLAMSWFSLSHPGPDFLNNELFQVFFGRL